MYVIDKVRHFGQFYLSHEMTAVAVGYADTQERPQNIVAETLNVARVGADGREMSGHLWTIADFFTLTQRTNALPKPTAKQLTKGQQVNATRQLVCRHHEAT